jgi:hypothetical protein
MTAKLWKDFCKESKHNPLGEMRYFINNISESNDRDDFDLVKNVLVYIIKVSLIDEEDLLVLRVGLFEKSGNRFKLYWDEEFSVFGIGLLLVTVDHSEKESQWLEDLINEIIKILG